MTGCNCCRDKNFDRGFYKSKEEAMKVKEEYSNGIGNPLSSQYAKFGLYFINECEAEVLPDGRIIIEDRVFSSQDYFGYLEW